MKQQEVFKKIGGIIKELNDQYKYLEDTEGKLNDIELEFFVANTTYLAQNAEMLRKLNEQTNRAAIAEPVKAPKDEKYFEPLVHKPEPKKEAEPVQTDAEKIEVTRSSSNDTPAPHIDIAAETPGDDYSYVRQEPEIIRHELEIDESWLDDEDESLDELLEESKEPVTKAAPVQPVKTTHTPLKPAAEKQQAPKQGKEIVTVNQKISAQLGKNQSSELSPMPISDLKQATTLNDKLLYVKDLFNGYSLAYSEAIEILNRFNTFEEADHYLKSNYVTKNNWESKPETTEKFYDLLKRRFV